MGILMPATIRTELRLPLDARLEQVVQGYVRHLAELAGLPAVQAATLALFVWQACRNAINHAVGDAGPDALRVAAELTPASLTLSICDQGMPFYQTGGCGASAPGPAGPPSDRRGAPLSAPDFDEVQWLYHGVEGNELRLTKTLREVCGRPTPASAPLAPAPPTAPAAAPEAFSIRLVRPEDAVQLTQLLYRVYGYTYPHRGFYYPEWISHNVATGRLLGVVAVTPGGDIVGHDGFLRLALAPLGELGILAVAPAYRGQGLLKRMSQRLQEEIERLRLLGLYGQAVTIHTISQEAAEERGLRVAGLKLLDLQAHFEILPQGRPPSSQWEKEAAPGLQRLSTVFYFKYLRPPPPGPQAVCAPLRHRAMLAKIYDNLGMPVRFVEGNSPQGPGEMKVHYDQTLGVGAIQVNRIGGDSFPEIAQARRDLCALAGAKVVGLSLPLAQGGTPDVCRAAQADGFLFSGILPHFAPDGDFLRLQYLNADLDPAGIHLYSPFARELLAYILHDREQTGR